MPTLPEANGIDQPLLSQKPKKARKEPLLLYMGYPISGKKVRKETERCARSFLRWGIKPGSAVFLCLTQTPELLYSLFAIWRLGGVAHLIDPSLPPNLLKDYISAAKGELLLLTEGYAHRFCGFLNGDFSLQTILVPLTQSLPLFSHRRRHSTIPTPLSSLSHPRLLLWKDFLESGTSLSAAESPFLSPNEMAAVYYPPFTASSGLSMTHAQICDSAEHLKHRLPSSSNRSRLLSQLKPWQPEALSPLLLPFFSDICLLLEPQSSHSGILETILTEKPDILHCEPSFFLWIKEQKLVSAALSQVFLLPSDGEAQE